jgi:spore maturation protein SpmB
MKALQQTTVQLAKDIWQVYWTLVKIMVPSLIIVKALELAGAIDVLAVLLAPVMSLVGLPAEMGVVWATSLLTNIYTAMAVYFDLAAETPLTVAQISVLGTMILVGHALPVEGAIAKKAGLRWRTTLLLRVLGALVLGAILNLSYSSLGALEQPAQILWQPAAGDDSLLNWAVSQLKLLATIPLIIAALMVGLRLLRWLGIEKLMHWLLDPVLKLLGMSKAAANTTVIGMTLGLAFGGGLLIQEAKQGHMSRQDVFLSMSLIALCHSLIEDTLLILLLGADLSAILWSRLAFALIFIALLAQVFLRRHRSAILGFAMTPEGT